METMKVNFILEFNDDTFDEAVNIYEEKWDGELYDITPNQALDACISAIIGNDEEDYGSMSKFISEEDKRNLLIGFALAYQRRVKEAIYNNLELD